MASRPVASIVEGIRTLEGGGFEVRRPFPTEALLDFDPFLLLDEMGPAVAQPGKAIGTAASRRSVTFWRGTFSTRTHAVTPGGSVPATCSG